MSNKSILARFSSSAVCVLVARILAFIAVFGFNAVLARSLEPTDFGLFALLFSLATLTSLLASCGMNRALVKVLAEDSSHDKNIIAKIVSLGVMTSVAAGLLVGVSAFLICSQFMPAYDGAARWAIAGLFGGIVLVRNIHFVLAETTRGFHETNWSNLFGGPAGGPVPHLIFLIALIVVWSALEATTLTVVLSIYLACFTITLPPLVMKLYSLTIESGSETESSFGFAETKVLGAVDLAVGDSADAYPDIWLDSVTGRYLVGRSTGSARLHRDLLCRTTHVGFLDNSITDIGNCNPFLCP